jgi:hypothetical protein
VHDLDRSPFVLRVFSLVDIRQDGTKAIVLVAGGIRVRLNATAHVPEVAVPVPSRVAPRHGRSTADQRRAQLFPVVATVPRCEDVIPLFFSPHAGLFCVSLL